MLKKLFLVVCICLSGAANAAVIQSSASAGTSVRYNCSDFDPSDAGISETASSVSSEAECKVITTNERGTTLLNEGFAYSEVNLADASFKSKVIARSIRENVGGIDPARFTTAAASTYFQEEFTFDRIAEDGKLFVDFNVEGIVSGTGFFQYEIGYTTASNPFQRLQKTFQDGVYEQTDSYEIDLGHFDTYVQFIIKTNAGATANALTGLGGFVDFSNTSWLNLSLSNGEELTPSDSRTLGSPRANLNAVEVSEPSLLFLMGFALFTILANKRSNQVLFTM